MVKRNLSLRAEVSLSLHFGHGLAPYAVNIKNPISHKCGWGFHISVAWLVAFREDYLFENCGALRAALRPYFLRSFIRGSRVKYPADLRVGLYSASASRSALEIP